MKSLLKYMVRGTLWMIAGLTCVALVTAILFGIPVLAVQMTTSGNPVLLVLGPPLWIVCWGSTVGFILWLSDTYG